LEEREQLDQFLIDKNHEHILGNYSMFDTQANVVGSCEVTLVEGSDEE
jgi:hypothetical protein